MNALERWLAPALWAVGALGAGYLSYEHATGSRSLACANSGVVNCAAVTTSQYSLLLGLPVAYLGLAYLLGGLALAVLGPRWLPGRHAGLEAAYAGAGVLFVLYLIYAELMLGQLCTWCTVVHVLVIALFGLAAARWWVSR